MARATTIKYVVFATALAVVFTVGSITIYRHQSPSRALKAMAESAHALKQVHVVFKLTTASYMDGKPGTVDADGLSEIQSRYYEGDIASGDRYHLRCDQFGGVNNPTWNGNQLVNWGKWQRIWVSDGHDLMAYSTGNQTALIGSLAVQRNGQILDAIQGTQRIRDWFSNPNNLDNFDKLTVGATPTGDQPSSYFQKALDGKVIGLFCDPAKSYLAERRTLTVNGELFGDSRRKDLFEISPGVWRSRKIVDQEFTTRRFILAVQKDDQNARDHMISRATLEIMQATAVPPDESLFRPIPPDQAQWVYQVQADGSETAVRKPPGN